MSDLVARVDKLGLDRSVLTYVDVSCQSPGRFFLIIDESYGKALFSVDQIEVKEHEIVAYRDTPSVEVVTRFSPGLIWRIVNKTDVYVQSTRAVMEREAVETKDLRAFRDELVKAAGLDGPLGGIPEAIGTGHGQYL